MKAEVLTWAGPEKDVQFRARIALFQEKKTFFKKFNLKENIKEKVSLVSRAVMHGPYVMTSYQIVSRPARPKSVNWYNFLCYISLCD